MPRRPASPVTRIACTVPRSGPKRRSHRGNWRTSVVISHTEEGEQQPRIEGSEIEVGLSYRKSESNWLPTIEAFVYEFVPDPRQRRVFRTLEPTWRIEAERVHERQGSLGVPELEGILPFKCAVDPPADVENRVLSGKRLVLVLKALREQVQVDRCKQVGLDDASFVFRPEVVAEVE